MSRPKMRLCVVCGCRPAAMARVDYCFTCWPGGPVAPPPCLRCGSGRDYYAAGLCTGCHRYAAPRVDSCLDCLAWGATRHNKWLCKGCVTWRRAHPSIGACPTCSRTVHLGEEGCCRLCRKQATRIREGREVLDIVGANRHGQQLFIADLFSAGLRRSHTARPARPPAPAVLAAPSPPVSRTQLVLFPARRDLKAHGRPGLPPPPVPELAAELDGRVEDRARRFGWSRATARRTRDGIRILLGLQDTPGAAIRATDAAALAGIDLPVRPVLEVLDEAGMLDDDRAPAIESWFDQRMAGLPTSMIEELRVWFGVMVSGSTTSPRRRPRSPTATRLHLRWALPTLHAWAAAGHTSLREINREHVLAALPASGNPRATTGQGLKSIFSVLRGRKVVFVDPTTRIRIGWTEGRQPLPLDPTAIAKALNSANVTQAVLVALAAFHGLRSAQLRGLRLTDVRDGRLHLDERIIPIAEPVRARLQAYLDYRSSRWPDSPNPYLFIHFRSALRTEQPGPRWLRLTIGPGLTAQGIREDRILNEAHATAGDARQLQDLFGLSIQAASRYTATVDNPDLIALGSADS